MFTAPAGGAAYLFNLRVKGIEVEPDVDALAAEGLHAPVVILGAVDKQDVDRVGPEVLQQPRVDLALLRIQQGIDIAIVLVCDA